MKIITKTPDRKVTVHRSGEGDFLIEEGDFLIEEGSYYTPPGHSRKKWDSTRIYLTTAELRAILWYAESAEDRTGQ